MSKRNTILIALLLIVVPQVARTSADYDAIVGPSPAGPMNCIAVEITTPPTGLTGLRWLHNDAAQSFPRLLLVEGEAGVAPDLAQPGLVLFELEGPSLTWGQVDFGGPVSSSTGTAYAVIFFPENVETTDVGSGGGPGIGVRATDAGRPFYLSADGVSWAPFDAGYELAVEVETALSRARPRVLSEMETVSDVLAPTTAEVVPLRTTFDRPFPNPFNPRVELAFALAEDGVVRLEIYDLRGRRVTTLAEGQHVTGRYTVVWDGTDQVGHAVASGVYFARFSSPDRTVTHRMALIR